MLRIKKSETREIVLENHEKSCATLKNRPPYCNGCQSRHPKSLPCAIPITELDPELPKLCIVSFACKETGSLMCHYCCSEETTSEKCVIHETKSDFSLFQEPNFITVFREVSVHGEFQISQYYSDNLSHHKSTIQDMILERKYELGRNSFECKESDYSDKFGHKPKCYNFESVKSREINKPMERLVKDTLTEKSFRNSLFIGSGKFLTFVYEALINLNVKLSDKHVKNEIVQ